MPDLDLAKMLRKLKPLLLSLIRNFTTGDYQLRRESAIALSKFKGNHVTDFLLAHFESDNIQDFMALALGNIDNQKAVKLLINALNDSNTEVRFHAARSLGMIKNNEAFTVLMEVLNEYVDSAAAGISRANSNQVFFEEDAIISAITALGKLRNHLSVALLKRILAQEKSPRIRASVIIALGGMANERMLPIFQAALRDEDSRVRANAIESIELIKSNAIVGILQPYLEDPSNRVRANVAKAIWKYGDFDVTETLTNMLTNQDKWQRASAAYAMGDIHDVKFIPKLAIALKDEDPDVRRNAVNALRRIESPNAFSNLIPLLEDPNYEVRVHATLAIARCNPQKAPDLLAPRLAEEKNPNVRATLISCLGESGRAQIRENIEPFLDDEDSRVVANAVDSIQKLSQGNAYPKLTKKIQGLLSHEDNRVKSNAIKALWFWSEFDVLDNLHDLLSSKDQKHCQSGIFVLGEIGNAIGESVKLAEAVNQMVFALASGKEPDIELLAGVSATKTNDSSASPETGAATGKPSVGTPPSKSAEPGSAAAPAAKKAVAAIPAEVSPPRPPTAAKNVASTTVEIKAGTGPIVPVEIKETFEEEIERATNSLNEKEFVEAEKIFRHVLEQEPNHLKALMGIGNLYFTQKRYPEAMAAYRQALGLNPNLVKAHYNLGSMCFFLKEYNDAREHLLMALKLYPKILGAYLILAQIFQFEKKTKESIQLLSKAIELSPRNPVLYQKLALLYFQLKDHAGAITVLEKAVQLSPQDIESNVLLAYAHHYEGNDRDGFAALDNALKACATASQPDEAMKILMQSYLFFKTDSDAAADEKKEEHS